MNEFISRAEFERRLREEERLREAGDLELARRQTATEGSLMATIHRIDDWQDTFVRHLNESEARRGLALNEAEARILKRMDALGAQIVEHETVIRQVVLVRRALSTGAGLLSGLPLLNWFKRLLGWGALLAAGVALGGLFFLIILSI